MKVNDLQLKIYSLTLKMAIEQDYEKRWNMHRQIEHLVDIINKKYRKAELEIKYNKKIWRN